MRRKTTTLTVLPVDVYYRLKSLIEILKMLVIFQNPYLETWTRTWEPEPVLGNLDLHKSLVRDPYSGTWTRTREPVLVYVLKSWPNIDDSYGIKYK